MAALLGLDEATVREWARHGRLRATRLGRKPVWFIDPIDEQPETIQERAAYNAQGKAVRRSNHDSTPPPLRARIDELLLEGHEDAAVAEHLNAEGWRRASGAPFDAGAVRYARNSCGLKPLWDRMREAGKLTAPEMAVRLGVGLNTVRNWVKLGRIRGGQCGRGVRARWLFDPIDEQPEPIRQRITARATMPPRRGVLSDAAAGRGAV